MIIIMFHISEVEMEKGGREGGGKRGKEGQYHVTYCNVSASICASIIAASPASINRREQLAIYTEDGAEEGRVGGRGGERNMRRQPKKRDKKKGRWTQQFQ